ncbi:hypothetical protein GOL96_31620 [Sinorhizobium medicae]|nr:hypothetical protein [Sinorhizobium medicae]MDX0931712.1 hypothetical protein [Sinorhizobium medicae]MDX1017262.1 hypothetical protein [Sinorhizobium medicae]MDX1195561.1 hypothetical protein [Sinorhizobium medicae]MDX1238222.1 hypothetical protein [Sinorhizobium medicae]
MGAGSICPRSHIAEIKTKAIANTEQEIARNCGKLSGEKFVANAKPDVVAAERERLGELEGQNASLKVAMARICEAA